jgi:hypothetical protein
VQQAARDSGCESPDEERKDNRHRDTGKSGKEHRGKRLSFYKSKLIVEQIGKSELYGVIQKVICVCISNYELFSGVKEYLNCFRFYNRENGLCFEEIPEEVYTVELAKVPEKDDGTAWRDRMSQNEGYYLDGLEKGKRESMLEIARNLKSLKVSVDKIVRATGLTPDEVAKL